MQERKCGISQRRNPVKKIFQEESTGGRRILGGGGKEKCVGGEEGLEGSVQKNGLSLDEEGKGNQRTNGRESTTRYRLARIPQNRSGNLQKTGANKLHGREGGKDAPSRARNAKKSSGESLTFFSLGKGEGSICIGPLTSCTNLGRGKKNAERERERSRQGKGFGGTNGVS